MIVTVDRRGRIVIPKPLRIALGIGPDTQLELMPDGAGLRLELTNRAERSIEEEDGLPLLGSVEGTELTEDDVRRCAMSSSAEHWACETRVAIPSLDSTHAAHGPCRRALVDHRPALAASC